MSNMCSLAAYEEDEPEAAIKAGTDDEREPVGNGNARFLRARVEVLTCPRKSCADTPISIAPDQDGFARRSRRLVLNVVGMATSIEHVSGAA